MYNTNLSVLRPTLVANELDVVAGRCMIGPHRLMAL
jgi:hypothetical protein